MNVCKQFSDTPLPTHTRAPARRTWTQAVTKCLEFRFIDVVREVQHRSLLLLLLPQVPRMSVNKHCLGINSYSNERGWRNQTQTSQYQGRCSEFVVLSAGCYYVHVRKHGREEFNYTNVVTANTRLKGTLQAQVFISRQCMNKLGYNEHCIQRTCAYPSGYLGILGVDYCLGVSILRNK